MSSLDFARGRSGGGEASRGARKGIGAGERTREGEGGGVEPAQVQVAQKRLDTLTQVEGTGASARAVAAPQAPQGPRRRAAGAAAGTGAQVVCFFLCHAGSIADEDFSASGATGKWSRTYCPQSQRRRWDVRTSHSPARIRTSTSSGFSLLAGRLLTACFCLSCRGDLQVALDLYRRAETYVPDNIKLKERWILFVVHVFLCRVAQGHTATRDGKVCS